MFCRYPEEEKAATGKPTGTTAPTSAERELSNGTDETLSR